MDSIIFSLPGNESLAQALSGRLKIQVGNFEVRRFPDDESYVRITSELRGKRVILISTLDHPDNKLLPLYFFSQLAKELGAKEIGLVAPYLAYMRQDKQFNPGEAVTSTHFARLISQLVDWMVTLDPHLHRRSSMSEIYNIPVNVLHASEIISKWIKENIKNALLVGPDIESDQWVREVAYQAGVPFIVLEKVRKGDRNVEIKVPDVSKWKNYKPVLIDDIISTAKTMIETIKHLRNAGFQKPVCIGVHAIFSGNGYEELLASGAETIVTCNTINHASNQIDISDMLAYSVNTLVKK